MERRGLHSAPQASVYTGWHTRVRQNMGAVRQRGSHCQTGSHLNPHQCSRTLLSLKTLIVDSRRAMPVSWQRLSLDKGCWCPPGQSFKPELPQSAQSQSPLTSNQHKVQQFCSLQMTAESGHQQHEIHNVQHALKIDMPEAREGDLQPGEETVDRNKPRNDRADRISNKDKELV